jgi:hypothetical protein
MISPAAMRAGKFDSLPESSKPLDNFPLMRTRSLEEVRETLALIYAKPVLTPTSGLRVLNAAMNCCSINNTCLYYRKYGAPVQLEFPETGYFVKLIPLRGNGELSIGKATLPMAAGTTAIVSPSMGWQLNCTADYEHLAVKIDARALTRKLVAMTGASIGAPLQLEAWQDPTSPKVKILLRYLHSLVGTLSTAEPGAPLPAWWTAQTEQLLMTTMLCCSRHNYDHLLDDGTPDVAPAAVRRAEDYIEANWRQPITLEDIAAAAGASELALFRSFRKSRGYSPLEFLAQIRARGGGMRE